MPRTIIRVNVRESPREQPVPLHNRWHPRIPPVVGVKPGDLFRVECIDWTGGQIKDNNSANDVRDVDLTQVHYLSGPISVTGAEPGDLLVVNVVDLGALSNSEWGFTGIFDKRNGGGFLTDHYPRAAKAIWHFEGTFARSRHIPKVRLPNMIHSGLMGTMPSAELLARWNRREADLIATNPRRVPPLAAPPTRKGALMGMLEGRSEAKKIAQEAARTVPAREHGGNCDIKNLSKGSTIYFPVYIKGAGLSMGDIHFSMGDGEISFCGAIEMAGFIDLRVDLIKGGVRKYGVVNPLFRPGPFGPNFSQYLGFEGISVDEKGKQHYMSSHIAYRRACLNAIEYLKKFGYSGEQAYLLLSCAPVEGRISAIVDIPSSCATLALPSEIFEFDILPSSSGPRKIRLGAAAKTG